MGQTLLFPDPKPVDQRLGRRFFRRVPRRPGVYLMKDASGNVLYVGKAKDLKQRLNNYRLANPDRIPRRHLRMVREVARIEFQFCANESAALRRESKLLRLLKPRFNRAGVWPGRSKFIVWRVADEALQVGVVEIPQPGWRRFGPLNEGALVLHQALSRLLWLAINLQVSVTGLPAGWSQGCLPDKVQINCGACVSDVLAGMEHFFWQNPEEFLHWLGARFCERNHPFERAVIAADLESLQSFVAKRESQQHLPQQFAPAVSGRNYSSSNIALIVSSALPSRRLFTHMNVFGLFPACLPSAASFSSALFLSKAMPCSTGSANWR